MGESRIGSSRSSQLHMLRTEADIDVLLSISLGLTPRFCKNFPSHRLAQYNQYDESRTSESPQIQEIRLYRELSKEIEKQSADRQRYLNSDIYAKARERSPTSSRSSEIQTTTVNIEPTYQSNRTTPKVNPINHASSGLSPGTNDNGVDFNEVKNEMNDLRALDTDGNCQVCVVKKLREDLTNITKVIQERNDQLTSKLKAKRMRSFFERHMLD